MAFQSKLGPSSRPRAARIGIEALDGRVLLSAAANVGPRVNLAIVRSFGDAGYTVGLSTVASIYSRQGQRALIAGSGGA